MSTAFVSALLSGVGFLLACLLATRGRTVTGPARVYAIVVAAGIILALAFGDLFPESLEADQNAAIIGFAIGFLVLYLLEVLPHAHTHHAPDEPGAVSHRHSLSMFVLGLALHNLADGFVTGVTGRMSTATTITTGFGILIHQLPVGISVAAVLLTARSDRRTVVSIAIGLGALIPLAALLTTVLPPTSDRTLGALLGAASGVLTYLGAAHLLPEARSEHPSRASGVLFAVVFVAMIVATRTILAD